MRSRMTMCTAAALGLWTGTALGHDGPLARPELMLQARVAGMPRGAEQEVRVLTATIAPGGETAFHSHRFPVTIYILEGSFSLEMEGRPAVTVNAGEALVEPAGVRMTGYNRSATAPMRVVIFYVSDPQTPFLDPVEPAAVRPRR